MNRDGAALVEVMAALVILGIAGTSALSVVRETFAAHEAAIAREVEMVSAAQVLADHALLPRNDLARRIGVRTSRGFAVWVDRPQPSLFRVGVAAESQPEAELIAGLLYRPERLPEGRVR